MTIQKESESVFLGVAPQLQQKHTPSQSDRRECDGFRMEQKQETGLWVISAVDQADASVNRKGD